MLLNLLQCTGQLSLCLNKELAQMSEELRLKKPWSMLPLEDTLVIPKLEAQKLFENHLDRNALKN